tara:strand:- start:14912 stop:16072 length:1161 start_codon:yes stop_codon:yes gene_type:complete
MKSNQQFDYIIVGGGLSGLHLSFSLLKDNYFKDRSILIIEKEKFNKKDNYFSFWESGNGKWDSILKNKWTTAEFFSRKGKIEMNFSNYQYKTLSSLEFRKFVLNKINKQKKFKIINDTVLKIREEKNEVVIVGNKKNYFAKHVFDSRLPENFFNEIKYYTYLKQHFIGWLIKTDEEKFNKNSFVFMDYRIRDKKSTAFTYILPFKKDKALIEHTYFSKNTCDKKVYEKYIKDYLKKYFGNCSYKIIKSESGTIPMSTYPFYKNSTKKITKIGTAGGWVKASTGYSFKNCEKYSLKILENIKNGKDLRILPKKRYYFLDKILLGVLSKYNYRGEDIFYRMMKRNSTKRVLRFLDEESTPMEILKIIISMRSVYFILIFIKSLFRRAL